MLKNLLRGAFYLGMVILFYGCGSTGVYLRSYIEDKPRVDQEGGGNAGYLKGTPAAQAQKGKDTRKIYVLEISKPAEEVPDADVAPAPAPTTNTRPASSTNIPSVKTEAQPVTNFGPKISIPSFDNPATNVNSGAPTPAFVEYKVEKDDTLQKISQKFYKSYGKWTKIYNANRDKIPNPDKIKPGIIIQIPLE